MPHRTVSNGESILSIAKSAGFFWQTIWNHAENAQLRSKRESAQQLIQGDEVFVPDLERKEVSKPTDQRHEFKRKGDPVKYRLRLSSFGEPRANEAYVLEVAGQRIEGTTDGDGKIEEWMPGNATGGRVILRDGQEIYPIQINRLDPPNSASGLKQRLRNLGYPIRSNDDRIDEPTKAAIRAFQSAQGLPETGEADDATMSAVAGKHA